MTADSDQNITTNINRSGGVDFNTGRDIAVGGDVTGRDKITQIINNFFQGDTAQRDLRNRRNMLERVKNDWVKGVLEKSLYHEAMLDLGLEERPGEVQHPWDMMLHMPNRENRALPPGTKIMQVFDEMNHDLLILGEPGSGKTTMLLELARDTIARAEQDLIQPIPVVFNLSSWSDPKQSIADWLVRELHDKYDVHKKIAQPWIDNDDLLLLLDGLDEVKADRREACVKAINDFWSEHGLTQLAVCSRVADYKGLATQLKLDGAILIQPLMTQQIDEYLERAGNELAAVCEALRRDAELQELAQSPLMLVIMTLAYHGLPKDSIDGKQLNSVEGRRRHLFNSYVDKMFARTARAKHEPYSKEDTVYWLTWLAEKMLEERRMVFRLKRMEPSLLQTRSEQMMFCIGDGLLYGGLLGGLDGGLAGGLVGGLVGGLAGGLAGGLFSGLAGGLHVWSYCKAGIGGEGPRIAISVGTFGLLVGWLIGVLAGGPVGVLASKQISVEMVGVVVLALLFIKWINNLILPDYINLNLTFLQHLLLRFILWRKGYIPRDYARFLDYAAEHIFLRKVGGGYIFIHRMLMEYFASLETEPNAGSNE